VEDHLHTCAECARETDRQRSLAAALDRRRLEPAPDLLADCRRDLLVSLYRDEAKSARRSSGAWKSFLEGLSGESFLDGLSGAFAGMTKLRQPVGALALLAVGFFAARFTAPAPQQSAPAAEIPGQIYSTVRSVQPDASGRVQIAFDETRRRTVSGRLEDEPIRRLLLAAARDDNNAAVRVESMDLLKAASASEEIRNALLNAVANDPIPGVRLKALEGLKPMGSDPGVRKVLAQVLLADENPAVRMQAVDLLVAQPDDSMVGVLQNLVQKENNSYVRLKCEKALRDMNASIGTF
jgi:hypothetical protein